MGNTGSDLADYGIEVTLQMPTESYRAWSAFHFGQTGSDSGPWDPEALFPGKITPNLLHYAFGAAENTGQGSGWPRTVLAREEPGSYHLELSFRRLRQATDISYITEGSTNLQDWEPRGTISRIIALDEWVEEVTVRDTVPVSLNPSFFRVRVVLDD